MKRLLLILTLLGSFFMTKAQVQYQYIGTQSQFNRVQARNDFQVMRVFYPGLVDTTFSPTQNGAIITKSSDGQTYNFISNPGGKQWWSWTAVDTLFAKRGVNAIGKFFVLGNPKAIDSIVYLNGGNVNAFLFDSLGGTSGLYFKKLPFKSSLLATDSALARDSSGKTFVTTFPSGVTNLSHVASATNDTVKSNTGSPAILALAVAGGNAGLLGPNGMASLSNPLVFANYRGVGDTLLTAAPFADSIYMKAIGHGWGIAPPIVTQQSITLKADSDAIKILIGQQIVISNPRIFSSTALTSLISNTTTPTSVIGTGIGTKTIPANTLQVGQVITITGTVAITTGVSQSATFSFVNSTSTTGFSNVLPSAIVTSAALKIFFSGTILTTGSSGKMSGYGYYTIDGNPTQHWINSNTISINTTVSQTLDIQITWGAASTSNNASGEPDFIIALQ